LSKYAKRYKSGKYGWFKLTWGEPARSFGNIMKTYILHPDSDGFDSPETRVISVREASRIMGFSKGFKYPKDAGLGIRYQMIADSVSPYFSSRAASVIMQLLENEPVPNKRTVSDSPATSNKIAIES